MNFFIFWRKIKTGASVVSISQMFSYKRNWLLLIFVKGKAVHQPVSWRICLRDASQKIKCWTKMYTMLFVSLALVGKVTKAKVRWTEVEPSFRGDVFDHNLISGSMWLFFKYGEWTSVNLALNHQWDKIILRKGMCFTSRSVLGEVVKDKMLWDSNP